jgi:hypothetical protein
VDVVEQVKVHLLVMVVMEALVVVAVCKADKALVMETLLLYLLLKVILVDQERTGMQQVAQVAVAQVKQDLKVLNLLLVLVTLEMEHLVEMDHQTI